VQQAAGSAGGGPVDICTYGRHAWSSVIGVLQSTSAPVGPSDTGGRAGATTGGAMAGAGAPNRLAHLLASALTLQRVEISIARVIFPNPEFGFWNCWSSSQRQTGELVLTLLKAVQQEAAGVGSVPCT